IGISKTGDDNAGKKTSNDQTPKDHYECRKKPSEFLLVDISFNHKRNSSPSLSRGSPAGMSAPLVIENRIHRSAAETNRMENDISGNPNRGPRSSTGNIIQ